MGLGKFNLENKIVHYLHWRRHSVFKRTIMFLHRKLNIQRKWDVNVRWYNGTIVCEITVLE